MLFSDAAPEIGVQTDPRPKPSESLRIAWLIAWRSTLIWVLAVWLVIPVFSLGLTGILAAVGVSGESILIVVLLMSLAIRPALILPVVLATLIGKQLRGFDVVVERADGGVSDLSFREALAPAWLIYWRVVVITILAQFPLGAVLRRFKPADSASGFPDELILLQMGIALVACWFAVRTMFAKRFKLFRFVVRRRDSPARH